MIQKTQKPSKQQIRLRVVTNLKPGKKYSFVVIAVNGAGRTTSPEKK